jgi:hypothetical protein
LKFKKLKLKNYPTRIPRITKRETRAAIRRIKKEKEKILQKDII